MFYREHGVGHFHAEHQGQQATFTFDGKLLAGSLQSRTALRVIEEWATSHRQEVEANWVAGRQVSRWGGLRPLAEGGPWGFCRLAAERSNPGGDRTLPG